MAAIQAEDRVLAPADAAPSRRWADLVPHREGASWVLLALAMPRVFGPFFTIVLRRFLGPSVSGIFDSATVPYLFLDNFRNFGTGPALVYQRQVSREVANTAWTMNMLAAILVTGVAQLLAHPIAVYYGHPAVEGVLRVLSLAYVFASISSVHFFLLMRDLDFRARSIPAVGQVVAGGVVAVIFAVWGFGIGTLVSRELASVIAGSILLWAVYPFRPRVQLIPSIAWRLLRYGVWIGIGLSVLFMSQNVDVFIGARIIRNASDIGFYTTSWRLAFIAAGFFTSVASSVVFPTLTRLQHNHLALRAMLLKSIRQLGLMVFPASTALAILAPVIIVPLLGEKWAAYRSSFLVLSMLAVYAGNRTMLWIFFEGYKSIGKPWIVAAYNGVKLAVMVPAMIIGAQHGILGLALTYIPIQILEMPIALLLANRILRVSPREVGQAAFLPMLATLLMATAVIAVEAFLLQVVGADDVPTLLASMLVAGGVYLGSLYVLDRQILVEARGVLLRGL